jgi:hypothetical protein
LYSPTDCGLAFLAAPRRGVPMELVSGSKIWQAGSLLDRPTKDGPRRLSHGKSVA